MNPKRAAKSTDLGRGANRGFYFYKRIQLYSRVHSETLCVVAMRVYNTVRSPF
jgi:hypothetical protein